ncbi:MAG: hypothetical protein UY47_C0010G0007 [Parcubacteria group bacterium GW2011_GWB1_49_7]|nr:MAG: hypothetical protein UY47_C0010G0007 [Parcubacteria group bacterium GW2011_GWB1_49_7]
MKDFRFSILSGGMVAIVVFAVIWGQSARALTEVTVAATVTATNLAVSVADGSIAFGSVALNTATTTVTAGNDTQTVTNDGSDAALNVKSSNATGGTTWTLGTSAGSDIFKLEVSTTTGSTYMTLQATDTYLTASSSMTSLLDQDLDFRFTTPTASTDFVEKSLTITVQVTTQ